MSACYSPLVEELCDLTFIEEVYATQVLAANLQ